jgi:pantothenate kinase
MSNPIESLLSSFTESNDLMEVHDTYTHMSLLPSRHMRKSQSVDYFANNKVSNVSGARSTPAICVQRLPAAGVPTQIAELVKVRNNNPMLL